MSSSKNNISEDSTINYDHLLKQCNAWCGLNGLMYTDGKLNWTPAPVSLLPSLFSKEAYNYAYQIQPTLNLLIDRISRDKPFLISQLTEVSNSDNFTKKLLDIYQTISHDYLQSCLQCGLLRSDYMVNYDDRPLQVEINTIASSFGYLSHKVGNFHRYILDRHQGSDEIQQVLNEISSSSSTSNDAERYQSSEVVDNPSNIELAKCLAVAHQEYNNPKAIILFVVQPGERNIADQRSFEAQLWKDHSIKVEFMTLLELSTQARVTVVQNTESNNQSGLQSQQRLQPKLLVRPYVGDSKEYEVSVVYYRSGYSPNDYPTEIEWDVRIMMENSQAIKCPSVGYQLAGTKAIQAALYLPGVLEKYLSVNESNLIRQCFAAQYSMIDFRDDDESTKTAVEDAISDGSKWVLKPQREGGGNNYYGEELSAFLKTNRDDPILQGYVLMQRIFPSPQSAAFLRNGKLDILPSISELGIYGTFVGYGPNHSLPLSSSSSLQQSSSSLQQSSSSDQVVGAVAPILNSYGGYLLRTKPLGVDEGGVATGYSVLNSIVLK